VPSWYRVLVFLEIALAAVTFVALRFTTAPYGRYLRKGWGRTVPARAGWLVMESVSSLLFAVVFWSGPRRTDLVALVLFAMWQSHYLYRAFVYPLLLRGGRRMPVVVVLLAIAFNVLNASVNAYLGEMLEWTGWALATWSPAGFAFALYTVANLAPRAVDHHAWYHQQFPEYPAKRRALIPYVI
jgi:3-oxo-5-alpha-steroid 4-dehydrogenase 1